MTAGHWIAYRALARKEIKRFMRNWRQRFAPGIISGTLYLLVFGHFMGDKIGSIHNISYSQFILPGLVVFYSMTTAYMNTCFSFFLARRYDNSLQRLLMSPMPNYLIIAGFFTASVLRGVMMAIAIVLVGAIFAPLTLHHPLLFLTAIMLIALTFAAVGMVTSLFMTQMLQIHIVHNFLMIPLNYFAGIFYSINMLPKLGRIASLFNPISYMVNFVRYSMIGRSDIAPVPAFSVLVVTTFLCCAACFILFNRGVGIRK